MVLRSTFPQSEIDLYKRNAIEGLKAQRANAGFLANEQAARVLYGSHPYGVVSPSAANIESLSREKNREKLLSEIKDNFGGWQKGTVAGASISAGSSADNTTIAASSLSLYSSD